MLTVQGKTVSVGSSALAAIDTGTTLIAAPTTVTASIWAQVPGSIALMGAYTGLYAFRQYHLYIAGQAKDSSIFSLFH